ncbi:MAG: type II toxin-antitoxin system RelB family antitoxin [Oscillospiraceae bacterium]
MAFSIRMTEQERSIAESYARLHSMSLGEAFKQALFEKIEEEYDIAVFDEAYAEYVKEGKKSRPIDKLWQDLDL